MYKILFPVLGIVSAVVIFLSISVFYDYSKALNSIKNNHSPSASSIFSKKQLPSAKLMSADKQKNVLGTGVVKAAEDAEIIFDVIKFPASRLTQYAGRARCVMF